ncbi:hypothetical protein [Fluviicola sp.]|uniref:hypothetical protein n=1 Tax=Fluviicola sp. TaxID=1917219 RepID=UPI0031DA06E1
MYRSAKYRNTLNLIPLLLGGILILCVNYQIIVWGIKRDYLSVIYFIWVLIGFLIFIFYLELIYFMYSVMEITPREIIFTKPWRRFGLFRKRQSKWIIPHSEWTELHAFHVKSNATLYFRKERDSVFFATIEGGSTFARKIKKHFREKLIYYSPTQFPQKLRNQMLDESSERVMRY